MKRILIGLSAIVAVVIGLSGCSADRTNYNGPEYVMFSDTLSHFPVQNSKDYFNVHIASTNATDYDRTFAVEVDDKNTNAIENKHYVIESNTVTIKAGERAADLKIRGIYENIENADSLSITLRLISKENTQWGIYEGTKTRVQMIKSCPFDLNVFSTKNGGYCKLRSTFFNDYMMNTEFRLLKSDVDPKEENTIIIHDYFYKGYDIKLRFNTTNPLTPDLEMDDQILGSTAEAFGTIHGDGKLRVEQPVIYTSYYNVCQKYVLQYVRIYVEPVGTVGTYVNVLEWITDEEAELLKSQGY